MRSREPARFRTARGLALAIGLAAAWLPDRALAQPGQAIRLGGIEPQGPATRAVTALHHNPAMLGALQGTAVQVAGGFGLEYLRVHRSSIDAATGEPIEGFEDPATLLNPSGHYFLGASFYFDPLAVGIGVYDLSSSFRLRSADALRYHLAPDPDAGCIDPTRRRCPPDGGAVTVRQDLTVALAYNRGDFQLGAAVHFPRLRQRFAFDNDTALQQRSDEAAACTNKEDAACAERVGFKGWTHWFPRRGAPAGFDAALTFGFSFSLRRETIVFGARYRTFPLRRAGEVQLGGIGLVCRPTPDLSPDSLDAVQPCSTADPVGATLRERLPQEVAVGGSFLFGRTRRWQLDTQFYWIDFCPGGVRIDACGNRDAQVLALVGLDRSTTVLSEFPRYRGLQDVFGVEVHAAYRLRPLVALLFGSMLSSPSVKRNAQTAALGEGFRLGFHAGARVHVGNLVVTPGYAVDVSMPRRVRPNEAAFDPGAATAHADAYGDLNDPSADAVLEGRARATNAGRSFGMVHGIELTLIWGE